MSKYCSQLIILNLIKVSLRPQIVLRWKSKDKVKGRSFRGVVANVLDCDIVVNEF